MIMIILRNNYLVPYLIVTEIWTGMEVLPPKCSMVGLSLIHI